MVDQSKDRLVPLAERGLLESERIGRRTRWALSEPARRLLTEGSRRIYSLHRQPRPWDGRWLLLTWPTADQWVFVRVTGGRRIVAVSGITRQLGARASVAGWCCR